jgi:hypothetical protein
MNTSFPPPTFDDAELRALNPTQLLEVLKRNEDRVPRVVIDECARCGDDMVQALARVTRNDDFWKDGVDPGEWWLGLHTVMVLGLIPGEGAGRLLVDIMRRISEADDIDMQDWCAGYWPALFRNKPDTVLPALRTLSMDRNLDWYIRANAVEPIVAAAEGQDNASLDEALAWLAGIAADEDEEWDLRLSAAHLLIDFPRASYRPLLESLAARQIDQDRSFSREEIETAYAAGKDEPEWLRFADPWKFYSSDAIEQRQAGWANEGAGEITEFDDEDDLLLSLPTPFTRPVPKTGRNDPCPCGSGSGKKYKKCCLIRDEA